MYNGPRTYKQIPHRSSLQCFLLSHCFSNLWKHENPSSSQLFFSKSSTSTRVALEMIRSRLKLNEHSQTVLVHIKTILRDAQCGDVCRIIVFPRLGNLCRQENPSPNQLRSPKSFTCRPTPSLTLCRPSSVRAEYSV